MGTRNTNTRCVESMMQTRRRRSAMWALLVIVGSVLPLAWGLSTIRAQTASHMGAPAQPSQTISLKKGPTAEECNVSKGPER